VATFTTYDQGNALQLKGSTGNLLFIPYWSPTIGARINAENSAGSAYTPLSFYASIFYFNSNVNFASTIGNGTYTYTLPSATGTLALTSAIPANPVGGTGTTNYLPKFTGASTIGDSIISENSNEIVINVADPTLVFNGSRDYALQSNNTSGNFRIIDNTVGLERLSIASTGAATFSSSVTATQGKFSGSRPQGIFTENGTSGLYLRDATGTGYKSWSIGTNDIVVGFAITPSTAVGGTTFTTPSFVINESGNVGIGTSTITTFATNYTALNINAATGYGSGTIFKINNVYECGFYSETGITTLNIAGAYAITGSFGTAFKVASGGNVLIGTTTDAGQKLQVNGTALIYDSLRLRSSSYGANYNTSIRSDASACGILQFGNNNDNYILAGNTGTGGYLIFRVNCSTESITSGSLALTLNSNATAVFASSVTATSFFESSDSRLKTLIQDNYQTKGIASITPKLYTKNGKVELGYYAQDFVGILDSAVSKGSDNMLSLSYREVLVAKVYALEQEIKELKGKMN
jgi:hypothetical protein